MSGSTQSPLSPSKTIRTIEERLADYFPADRQRDRYTDAELIHISSLLEYIDRPSWAKVPRIYTVLRVIGQLQLLDSFINQGYTDIYFPFSQQTLPPTISPSLRGSFLHSQTLILSKAYDLENDS